MKSILEISSDLNLTINNGECLQIIKREAQCHLNKYENLKADEYVSLADIRQALHTLQAYEVLIDNFEKYLGHER